MTKVRVWPAALAAVLLAHSVGAQEKAQPEPAPLPPLSVELAVSRRAGEQKLERKTYAFPCQSRERTTVIRSGVEVPVPVRKGDAVEYQYRNVGANIECESALVAGGRYSVRLSFEQSSLVGANEGAAVARAADPVLGGAPIFRTSLSRFAALLRPGETAEVVSASDSVTGEATALEVTLKSPR